MGKMSKTEVVKNKVDHMFETDSNYINRLTKTQLQAELQKKEQEIQELHQNIDTLAEEIEMLAKAAAEGKTNVRGDVKKFKGKYAEIVQGFNNVLDAFTAPLNVAIEYVDRISKGDIPKEITEEYYGDFNILKNNLNNIIKSLNSLIEAAATMAEAARNGRLDVRMDVSKFSGAWATIVQGLNDTAESIAIPLRNVVQICKELASGNLSKRIDLDVKGEFKELVDALNNLAKILQEIIKEIDRITDAMASGDLSVEFEVETPGDFSAIRENINKANFNLSNLIAELQNGMQNVASTAQESASSVQQINAGMQQISTASQEIAKGAQEISSAINGVTEEIKKTNNGLCTVDYGGYDYCQRAGKIRFYKYRI